MEDLRVAKLEAAEAAVEHARERLACAQSFCVRFGVHDSQRAMRARRKLERLERKLMHARWCLGLTLEQWVWRVENLGGGA